MAFTQKLLSASFDLAQGVFSGGGNSAKVDGLRMALEAQFPSGESQGSANAVIWGMPLSLMNQLSTMGTQINQAAKNSASIFAGETGGQMSLVYQGTIFAAFVDGAGMPDVPFHFSMNQGNFQAVQPAKPISIKGSADVAGLMSNLAKQMGMTFENAGVVAKLANPYFPGTAWQQALAIARHANIDVTFDRGTMAIAAPAQARAGGPVLISKETGMIGYPAFVQNTVIVRCLFNPNIGPLKEVQIQSDLTPANGMWKVINMTLDLQSNVLHGKWEMILTCVTTKSGTS